MGLIDSAYWITWLLWEIVLVFISSLLLVLFGMMFQFDFFLNNDFGILFFLFFLFQLNMVNLKFTTFFSPGFIGSSLVLIWFFGCRLVWLSWCLLS